MRTLTRLRQLASGLHIVQIVRLEKGHQEREDLWTVEAEFATEREAELFARDIADRQEHEPLSRKRRRRSTGTAPGSAGYWHWPLHTDRAPLT